MIFWLFQIRVFKTELNHNPVGKKHFGLSAAHDDAARARLTREMQVIYMCVYIYIYTCMMQDPPGADAARN